MQAAELLIAAREGALFTRMEQLSDRTGLSTETLGLALEADDSVSEEAELFQALIQGQL